TRGGATVTIKGSNFAPDSVLVIGGVLFSSVHPTDTQTITVVTQVLPSGRITVTVQNRGGIAQTDLLVDAIPLDSLAAGQITTVAGGTTFAGDGRSATAAILTGPDAMALDAAGNLFIADSSNYRIRRVAAGTGIITTVAGTGTLGSSGDGGPATAAELLFT